MKKAIALFVLFSLAITSALAQKGTESKAVEGQSYRVNLDTEIDGKPQHFINSNGDIFLAFFYGGRYNIHKYNSDLDFVKEAEYSPYGIKGVVGDVELLSEYIFQVGDNLVIVTERVRRLANKRTRLALFLDSDLNELNGGWQPFVEYEDKEIHQRGTYAPFRELNQLKNFHTNSSGMVALHMNYKMIPDGEVKTHLVTRFDPQGKKVYDKEITFNQSAGRVFLSKGLLIDDGSFIYFGQQGKNLFYRVITDEGDEIEDELGFEEGTFIMLEVVPDPNDPESAILMGLDEKLHLAIYYFRFSGFDEYDGFKGETVVPACVGEADEFYISDLKGEFRGTDFYAGAVAWKGGFREGYTSETGTQLMGVKIDLKGPKIKNKVVSTSAKSLMSDYDKAAYKPTQVSKIVETDVLDGQIYFKIKEYSGVYGATEPYGSFRYTYMQWSTIFVDIDDEDFSRISGGKGIGETLDEGGSRSFYTVKHNKKDKMYKKTPYVVIRNYYRDGALTEKKMFHLSDFVKGNEHVLLIGYHTDSDGNRFMYAMRPRSKYELLKVPLPEID